MFVLDPDQNLKSRKVETRLNYSGVLFRKTLDQFNFSFQPSIGRNIMDGLMTLRLVHNTENVVFLSCLGVGKTNLSIALEM
jgi:DNA replication protein DnaC